MNYGYEYFSGANVVVELDGVPAFECAGISCRIQESKIPIYGYSSRFFDAVARGQVLVQGNFVVNYIHHNYVYSLLSATASRSPNPNLGVIKDDFGRKLRNDRAIDPEVANQLKAQYWNVRAPNNRTNPHDLFGGFAIKVSFGERTIANNFSGLTGFYLNDVYILGRGKTIQISEDVIVEEFPFFARDMTYSDPKPRLHTVTEPKEGSDEPVETTYGIPR